MNYNKVISKVKKNKYQNYLNLNKKFYFSYINSRLIAIDELNNNKTFKKENKFSKKNNNKVFNTYNNLYLIFNNFKKSKDINKINLKIIFLLYKKFEKNLILRENYNQNLLKISKKETNLNSYILLNFLSKKLYKINHLQKINFSIKIHDHLIINKFNPKEYEIKKLFIKNIKYEINNVQKLIKS